MADVQNAVVLLDLDGTLVDTMDALADLAAELLESARGLCRPDARRLYLETSGVPFRQQLERILPGDRGNDEVSEAFE